MSQFESVALDGGVLIALALGEEICSELKNSIIKDKVRAISHELAVTEMAYILCRHLGWEIAATKIDNLMESGYISIKTTAELIKDAAAIKCKRSLALPDCFTLATAKRYKCQALFVSMEDELKKEISRKQLGINVSFLSHK